MKKSIFIITLIVSFLFLLTNKSYSNNSFFEEGKKLFLKKDYTSAKFKFQKDIVFNPKNENSYLYLARIFNKEKKVDLAESNLNTDVLLNPTNEEALYELALRNIQQSNFDRAEELIEKFKKACKKNCEITNILQKIIGDSLKK